MRLQHTQFQTVISAINCFYNINNFVVAALIGTQTLHWFAFRGCPPLLYPTPFDRHPHNQTVLYFIRTLVYSELLHWLATLYGTERPTTACGRYSLRGRCAFRNANIALVCIPRLSIPIISHAIWYITLATHSKTDRHRLRLRRFTTRGCCAFRNANASLVYISRAMIREYGRPRPLHNKNVNL